MTSRQLLILFAILWVTVVAPSVKAQAPIPMQDLAVRAFATSSGSKVTQVNWASADSKPPQWVMVSEWDGGGCKSLRLAGMSEGAWRFMAMPTAIHAWYAGGVPRLPLLGSGHLGSSAFAVTKEFFETCRRMCELRLEARLIAHPSSERASEWLAVFAVDGEPFATGVAIAPFAPHVEKSVFVLFGVVGAVSIWSPPMWERLRATWGSGGKLGGVADYGFVTETAGEVDLVLQISPGRALASRVGGSPPNWWSSASSYPRTWVGVHFATVSAAHYSCLHVENQWCLVSDPANWMNVSNRVYLENAK